MSHVVSEGSRIEMEMATTCDDLADSRLERDVVRAQHTTLLAQFAELEVRGGQVAVLEQKMAAGEAGLEQVKAARDALAAQLQQVLISTMLEHIVFQFVFWETVQHPQNTAWSLKYSRIDADRTIAVSMHYRGTSLIRNSHPPRTTIGPYAYSYCRVLRGRFSF